MYSCLQKGALTNGCMGQPNGCMPVLAAPACVVLHGEPIHDHTPVSRLRLTTVTWRGQNKLGNTEETTQRASNSTRINYKQQRQAQSAPAGRGPPRNQRLHGQSPLALAAIGRGGEQRACHICGKVVHLRAKCSDLHLELRKYLALNFGRVRGGGGGGPGRGNGGQAGQGGRGGQAGPAVAATTEQRLSELVKLTHSHPPVEPMNFLIHSC